MIIAEKSTQTIKVKLISSQLYKETYGVFVDNNLICTGTEMECTFMKLRLLSDYSKLEKQPSLV